MKVTMLIPAAFLALAISACAGEDKLSNRSQGSQTQTEGTSLTTNTTTSSSSTTGGTFNACQCTCGDHSFEPPQYSDHPGLPEADMQRECGILVTLINDNPELLPPQCVGSEFSCKAISIPRTPSGRNEEPAPPADGTFGDSPG